MILCNNKGLYETALDKETEKMFALDFKTNNNKDEYKPIFVKGRLRKYDELKNAVLGAVNFVKNPLNGYSVIRVRNTKTEHIECFIHPMPSGKPFVEYCNSPGRSFVRHCEKKNEIDSTNADDRIEFLKKCHEQHKQKKSKQQDIKVGESVNNISNSDTQQKTLTFLESFMADAIKQAIESNNVKTLFKTELSLSSKGLSWYPDGDGNIIVKPTKQVLDILNKRR